MLSSVDSEGLLPSGQTSASHCESQSLSAGLTAQESPWIGLLSRPTMSLLRFLPTDARSLTERVSVNLNPGLDRDPFPHGENVTSSEGLAGPGMKVLTDLSLQELGIGTEQVQEQRSSHGSVFEVQAAVSHLLLGCKDRPSPGPVGPTDLGGGLERFRGEMWTRPGLTVCEPTELETLETPKPFELLRMWKPEDRSKEGLIHPHPTIQLSPKNENLPESPNPPQEDDDPPPPRNKAIAFIMGFPCSDEDDGFDSEGSSSFSSSDEDDDQSDHLLRSLCLTSDPYNPRCFTAPLHTGAPSTRPSDLQAPLCSGGVPAPAPLYRRDEAAERLDSGFSEFTHSTKKVRFHDDVEEFTCEAEDRRGLWEELARDRLRFQRRCQELELQIAPCLQPQHRQQVYQRLHGGPRLELIV